MKKPIRNSDEAPDWPDEEWESLEEILRGLDELETIEESERTYNEIFD